MSTDQAAINAAFDFRRITRGKPRTAQINKQITTTVAKMTSSIFAVTDLKDIALSPLSGLANNAPKNGYAVPSHR
jgi:hypothetical protein